MIRVLIERRIAQGLEHYYDCTVKRTISQVVRAPGCIAGESLKDKLDPGRRIIMSKWESLEHWESWLHSPERKNVISELAAFGRPRENNNAGTHPLATTPTDRPTLLAFTINDEHAAAFAYRVLAEHRIGAAIAALLAFCSGGVVTITSAIFLDEPHLEVLTGRPGSGSNRQFDRYPQ